MGFVSDSSDCDDGDSTARPGATEYCDGVDDDCDGTVDDDDAADATTWYADDDGDGYGDSTTSTRSCSAPSGYISTSGDCDDLNASAHPGGSEVCDGADNDCDGTTDWTIDALYFNALRDYVYIPDHSALDMGTQGTIEAWIYWTGSQSGQIFNKWVHAAEDKMMEITTTGAGKSRIYTTSGSYLRAEAAASSVPSNAWTHIAVVWDSTGTRLYLNGYEEGSSGYTGDPADSTADAYIGAVYRDSADCTPMYGYIADVRISDTARYTAEFTPDASLTADSDTVGMWNLDEGTGLTAYDWSSNRNHGTIGGASWGTVSCRPGW